MFTVNLILLLMVANVLEAHNATCAMTRLEKRLLDIVEDCKSCKDNQRCGKERPAFSVTLSTGVYLKGSGEIVKFDHVILNRGGGYDTKTGKFTATISGLYQFSTTIMSQSGNDLYMCIIKNDAQLMNVYAPKLHAATSTANPVLELNKGDTVAVKHLISYPQVMAGSHFTYFSGYYISK